MRYTLKVIKCPLMFNAQLLTYNDQLINQHYLTP